VARLTLALVLALLIAAPASAETVVVGHSSQGRTIVAKRFGDADASKTALVIGQIHGDEPAGIRVTRALRKQAIQGVNVWVIDTVNPDGNARHTRQNAHGVDLNRNFAYRWVRTRKGTRYYGGPKPLSEPESRAVRKFILKIRPDLTIWYHQPWGAVLTPCDSTPRLQRIYAKAAHMRTSCRGAELLGTATSWENAKVGGHAFVVELAAGGISEATAELNATAAIATAKAV
jgi:murein peptide amidase A